MVKYKVVFDFDNTITKFDVLDDIIQKFATDDSWIQLEEDWKAGKIGSKECLKGQLASIRVTDKELKRYLSTVKIDPFFKKILKALRKKRIEPIILSDNFSFVIKSILKNNGIGGIKIYSKRLKLRNGRLVPFFPHTNKVCPKCGHCKTNNMPKRGFRNDMIVYIGDGHSDICPAENSDMIFAKASLLKHFRNAKRECVEFKTLKDVYKWVKSDKEDKSLCQQN